jgi:CRP/FNR family transcriptional regulator, cyclic AMP receptor protein
MTGVMSAVYDFSHALSSFDNMKPMVDIDTLLCWGATYKRVRTGEIIFEEGTQGRYFHQLVEGRVRWINVDDEGREFIQKVIEEGESFGELPLLDDGPYVATAVADRDSILIRLPKEAFLQLLRENPPMMFAFTRLMTQRLRNKFVLLKEVACQDPERKVITVLNMYKDDHPGADCPKCRKGIRVGLTRQEIADMVGLRVETVIRTIRRLNEKGVVEIMRGKVYVRV